MTGFEPIIYIISAIGTEIIKDVSKHLGKKTYEIESSLREPIIELGINDYNDSEEIQNKLKAKPEIKSEIEKKILDNQEFFNELLKALKETSNPTLTKFHSGSNQKVINVETNYGSIKM